MNPSPKCASMLLEIQIMFNFYHKNQLSMHKRIIKHLIKKIFTDKENTRVLKMQEVTSEKCLLQDVYI